MNVCLSNVCQCQFCCDIQTAILFLILQIPLFVDYNSYSFCHSIRCPCHFIRYDIVVFLTIFSLTSQRHWYVTRNVVLFNAGLFWPMAQPFWHGDFPIWAPPIGFNRSKTLRSCWLISMDLPDRNFYFGTNYLWRSAKLNTFQISRPKRCKFWGSFYPVTATNRGLILEWMLKGRNLRTDLWSHNQNLCFNTHIPQSNWARRHLTHGLTEIDQVFAHSATYVRAKSGNLRSVAITSTKFRYPIYGQFYRQYWPALCSVQHSCTPTNPYL